jgi:HD-GYP domain-containing protein (c-di-GMP phosphodiesterase class II)/CHASE1-domain containing sensor protein
MTNWRFGGTRWLHFSVALTLCLGVGFSLAAFASVRWWETHDIEKTFRLAAEDRAAAVKNTFDTEIAMLELVRSALLSDGRIERDEFHELATPFIARSNSIMAVEWVPRVTAQQRAEFEAEARRQGLKDFQITETDRDGQLTAAADRPEYYPILFIGPSSGDDPVYGYDVGSETVRLNALDKARDTGKIITSGRIEFVQDAANRDGFLAVLPVYLPGKPAKTLAQRRDNLWGFVLGVFQPRDMLESALNKFNPQGIDVCLYDPSVPAGGRPYHFHRSRTRNSWNADDEERLNNPHGMHYKCRLNGGGNPWTISCVPTPTFVARHRTWWPWGVLAAGIVLSVMLAVDMSSTMKRHADAEELLAQKRRYANELEQKVRAQTAHIRRAQEEIIHRLLAASQWRDEETGAHIRRVGLLSEVLARAAGWSSAEAECLRQAAPMHDVGKIGIPDAILKKPGKLTPEEFEVMKTHTLIGAKMLSGSDVPLLKMAREIALNHHERWDGQGYPHGLVGQDIPESARIVSIADVFDAMTHDRVYQRARSEDEAMTVLRQGAGAQFDPLLLAHFFLHISDVRRILLENPDETTRSPATWQVIAQTESTTEPLPVG